MQTEGITGQTDGNAVIGRHIYRRRPRRSDALHRNVFRGQGYLMLLGFFNDGVHQILVRLVRIRSTRHRHGPQVVLK